MKLLSIVCVSLAGLLLQPAAVWGQALTYDESLLRKYAEASQHLRTGLWRDQDVLWAETTSVITEKQAVETYISDQINAALSLLSDTWDRVSDMHLAANKILTPMTLAEASSPYVGSEPQYNNLVLDHGMGYDPITGRVVITKTGVYMLDFKLQTEDYRGCYSIIIIFNSAGWAKHLINTYHDWEVSPYFSMLALEVGDEVLFESLDNSNIYATATAVTSGPATQFNLRYLGQDII
ncbi:uncharacterized protein LOC143288389 [Babylonia areolata]|uniref:uncharacterized protein LOC143288389 n=1 Tax=Babylonia areolata TaxID=304850 RepID=UPI003FD2E421